jgi:hypothetical protein
MRNIIKQAILLSCVALMLCSCSKRRIDQSLKTKLSCSVQSDLEYEKSKSSLNWISEAILSTNGNSSVVLKDIAPSESILNPSKGGSVIYDVIIKDSKVNSLKVFSGPHNNLEFAVLKSFSDLAIWIDSKIIAKEFNQRTSEILKSSGTINGYTFYIISTQDLQDAKPYAGVTFIQVSNQEKDFICYSENKIADRNNHCRLVRTGNLEFQEFFSHMFGGDQSKSHSFDISIFHSPEQKMFWSILTVKIN